MTNHDASFEKLMPGLTNALKAVSGEKFLQYTGEFEESLPIIKWPLKTSAIRSVTYHTETGPGIIIETNYHVMTTIHSPADGCIETILQPDMTSNLILFARDPRLIILMGGIQETYPRTHGIKGDRPADSENLNFVNKGDLIGSVGPHPNNSLLLQVAFQQHGYTYSHKGWHLQDPRFFLQSGKKY